MAGSALAGSGIGTATFTIPNNTGATATNLHVTLTNGASSYSSLSFPNVSIGSDFADFSGGTVADGSSDEIFAQEDFIGTGSVALGLASYYWTDSGQQSAVYAPVYPVADIGTPSISCLCYDPNSYAIDLGNTNTSSLSYQQLNLTVNGTQLLSNSSGTVPNGTTVLATASTPLNSFALSFQDVSTGVSESVTFVATPEPGTLAAAALVLLAGLARWRTRRSRA